VVAFTTLVDDKEDTAANTNLSDDHLMKNLTSPPPPHDETNVPTTSIATGIPPHANIGVDPVYIKLFEEAKLRSEKDYDSSHRDGTFGIVIGPTEGKFKYTLLALENGKRIRSILGPPGRRSSATGNTKTSLKLALMTSPQHVEVLNACPRINQNVVRTFKAGKINHEQIKEACRLWANGTIFDHIIPMQDAPYKSNDNHTNLDQGSSKFWLKALGGYRLAPYKHSLFLDSDSYPCPGIEKLFQLTNPDNSNFGKLWQLPTTGAGDLAVGMDQFAVWQNEMWIPGDEIILADSLKFAERNTGAVLFSFERPIAHTLAHFIPLVSEHIYNNVASPNQKVTNDQVPFRVALYLFHRFQPDFVEHQIPMHASCRTYPKLSAAGTDGLLNGMFPLQQDGKPCSECSCSPCLISHTAGTYHLTIGGFMGWEEDAPSAL